MSLTFDLSSPVIVFESKQFRETEDILIPPKMAECAKKILGDDMGKNLEFMVRLGSGPFHQVMWTWEIDSLDQDLANQSKLMENEEWVSLSMQIVPYLSLIHI